jgi:hypothetical protein
MKTNEVVRVSVTNNFNCTTPEWDQLHGFEKAHPDKFFFINSNIKTPKLQSINNHPNKAVLTINPDILPKPSYLNSLAKLNPDRVAFIRIKYVPGQTEINKLIYDISEKYPIVITLQRFNSKRTLLKYTTPNNYKFSCSRYRLTGPALKEITSVIDQLSQSGKSAWICDRKGLGCSECGLCSKLTTGQDLKIMSLNLSSSGICPYDCPDCYAKTMQNFSRKMGHKPIRFDMILQNEKQAGKTVHIKRNKATQKCPQ